MESKVNTREEGLNELGKAYMAVKEGKASCVMLVIKDDELSIQTANLSVGESLRIIMQAADILTDELIQFVEVMTENQH